MDSMSNFTWGLPLRCKKQNVEASSCPSKALGGLSPREGLSLTGGMRSGRQEADPVAHSWPCAAALAKPRCRAASLPAVRQAA